MHRHLIPTDFSLESSESFSRRRRPEILPRSRTQDARVGGCQKTGKWPKKLLEDPWLSVDRGFEQEAVCVFRAEDGLRHMHIHTKW